MDRKQNRATYDGPMKSVRLKDIAILEGAKKGKIYKKGCILFWTQAGRGKNVEYLEEDTEVNERYTVAKIKKEYNSRYVFEALTRIYPRWIHAHMQNINLPWQELYKIKLDIHEDRKTQDYVADKCKKCDEVIKTEKETLNTLEEIKKTLLKEMFV